jgi:hypothetical protein
MEPPLSWLRERRAFECRLTPDRALGSLDEAEGFLRERGLLTRTTDCALPSLYEACHEEAYQPGGHGFASWPATRWPWFGELTGRGYLCVAVHRGKNLLVSRETAALLDPICRAETDRMRAADPGWRRLLDHLAVAGPSLADDLRLELGLKRQELKALRAPLERCGVLVARSVTLPAGGAPADDRVAGGSAAGSAALGGSAADGGGHTHSTELARWDQAYLAATAAPSARSAPADPADLSGALGDFIVAAVRAAVIAPEPEVRRWFSWQWYWTGTLIDDLVRTARLRRVDSHLAVPRGQTFDALT